MGNGGARTRAGTSVSAHPWAFGWSLRGLSRKTQVDVAVGTSRSLLVPLLGALSCSLRSPGVPSALPFQAASSEHRSQGCCCRHVPSSSLRSSTEGLMFLPTQGWEQKAGPPPRVISGATDAGRGGLRLRAESRQQEKAQTSTHRPLVCADGGEFSTRTPGNPASNPRLIPPIAERCMWSARPGKAL